MDSQYSASAECSALIQSLDQAVDVSRVGDRQDRRVSGFPYLRVNRLLASYRNQVTGAAFEQWLDELLLLGLTGWRIEFRNLSAARRETLERDALARYPSAESFDQSLSRCSRLLLEAQLADHATREALRESASVPDNYSLLKRSFGLYPLTSLGFRAGVSRWHREVSEQYAIEREALLPQGELIRYRPADSTSMEPGRIADILTRSALNSLAIPQPTGSELAALFTHFAPIYEIDTLSRDDRPGALRWQGEAVVVAVSEPVVYRYVTYTRFEGQALLQLNYLLWFPARTPEGRPDLLAGALDGLIWRVTLRPDGRPLVYDTIHPCGCYHLLFPGEGVNVIVQQDRSVEAVLAPAQQRLTAGGSRLVLRVAGATHYLERVYAADGKAGAGLPARAYRLRDADQLRSLPWREDQRRSLYGEDGLVAGSQRGERFLFWPMGIDSAGAMRQSGHQATAFVGRRHFDDADLFDHLLWLE